MEQEEIIIEAVENEQISKKKLLAIIEADNGNDYAGLLNDNNSIELVRFNLENDEITFNPIEDELEYKIAVNAFQRNYNPETGEITTKILVHDEQQEQVELPEISIVDENGVQQPLQILDSFEYAGRNYLAIIPYGELESSDLLTIQLIRVDTDNDDNMKLIPLTDMEYDEVRKFFTQRLEADIEKA